MMDIFDVLLLAGLFSCAVVAYLWVFRKSVPKHGKKQAGWNYPIKLLFARYAVRSWKAKLRPHPILEEARPDQHEGWDSTTISATAPDGTALLLVIRKLCARQSLVETIVHIKLPDGTTYVLPQSPEAAVSAWETTPGGWSANGLKIQVLEPALRLRILYNGLLTRKRDNAIQHVTLNLIWVSATRAMRHPEDWSNRLAAQTLAFERDNEWSQLLGKFNDGSWLQFGSMQGRFTSYDNQGTIDQSVYLQTRGVRERRWAPGGYQGLRRSVDVSVATSDGTVVQLRCLLYKDVLSQVVAGSVRFPNYSVESVTGTDLIVSEFCETGRDLPDVYTINVSTESRDLRLVLRINSTVGRFLSGVPIQHEVVFRTLAVEIDGYHGTGQMELGYESAVSKEPAIISRAPLLRWLGKADAGSVGYCVSFEDRAAACPDYVGGKGASLALLASVQKEEGYRVPPGFCLTINALEKHLEHNQELKAAIKEIEAANENYDETNFKAKCDKASSLFTATDIIGEVKTEILESMSELRKKAADENLGTELRFAVRSSAVGEDSEVLSAAGQNETILGCCSDDDVLRGVLQCWGSMFAFTSAYYRRQNGQPCNMGGGIVVQALVAARAAGVLFTRHPAAGDARRLLLTANYGLGETVVSGSVEPDTFIVTRSGTDSLAISQTVLGAKKHRATVAGTGVDTVEVGESERGVACLTETEVLRLAKMGVGQEELWGAGRDIEWAVAGNEMFLLQARPITSLERWTEEELLHELDCPIMSDDELITFGNTGEVLPRPMSPMSNDLVKEPLTIGIDSIVGKTKDDHDRSVVTTHYRCAMTPYNSIYRHVPEEVDTNIRMIEMAVHGHKVADDEVMRTALHRNRPRWTHKPQMIYLMIKGLIISKRRMEATVRGALAMTVEGDEPKQLLEAIAAANDTMMEFSTNHGVTSMASTFGQLIAMNVLLEGREEFSSEVCNEISSLLSSGDVLSAEVPNSLARLARLLQDSGHYDQFRAQDPKEAMQWLKKCLPQIYLEVCKFLERHGHRAIMEFDLSTKPWILVPEEMMKVLQNLRASPEDMTPPKTDDEIIASLKTPQKSSTRKVLRWVMPLCRRTVRHREGTKAHLILAVHKLRLAMLRLGRQLAARWYLPHPDLVFFFRFHELRAYLDTRDPALLRKAIQRHQYYPGWCKLKFSELNKGWLSPLAARGPLVTAADVKIEAASVCAGEVLARACVVRDLSEIEQLRQGDVLITHATDIGWSPYFPLLAGIVTELGGLISHGAVIAREYGLPCIVGAVHATDIFRTGDMVRLSGTKGTLERVQLQGNEQNGQTQDS